MIFNKKIVQDIILKDGSEKITLKNVLISKSRPKNIITTPIQGRTGTVKEYISNGDWILNVSGALIIESHITEVVERDTRLKTRELALFLDKEKTLEIINPLLTDLGIYSVVVEGYTLPEREEVNVQNFEISLVQDEFVELKLEINNA